MLRFLSREEREQVVELIEQDVLRKFEKLHEEEAEARKAEAAAAAANLAAWQEMLSESLDQRLQSCLAQLARRIGDFAILMAEKIVRREVQQDPEVLVRNLETVLFKALAGCALSVTVHPEDAGWLQTSRELCERLRIKEIKEDRRVDRGGCLVMADDEQWDATISRQLAALKEILDSALLIQAPAPENNGHA